MALTAPLAKVIDALAEGRAHGAALDCGRHANAERFFRRIRGYKQMSQLVTALHRHAHPETTADTETVGAAA